MPPVVREEAYRLLDELAGSAGTPHFATVLAAFSALVGQSADLGAAVRAFVPALQALAGRWAEHAGPEASHPATRQPAEPPAPPAR